MKSRELAILSKKRDTSYYFEKGEFYTVHKRFDEFILMKHKEYSKLDFVVLSWLQQRIGLNNSIKDFHQTEAAEALGSNQSNISRSLNKLRKDGIITRDKYNKYSFNRKYIRFAFDDEGKKQAKARESEPRDGDENDQPSSASL